MAERPFDPQEFLTWLAFIGGCVTAIAAGVEIWKYYTQTPQIGDQ